MEKQITMLDIAKEVGHSRRTVSSVINDKAKERGISKKTAQKILAYVKKRGYVPSHSALNLRGRSQNSIGILYVGGFYSSKILAYKELLRQLRSPGTERNLEIFIEQGDDISNGIKDLASRGVEKIICFSTLESRKIDSQSLIAVGKRMDKVVVYDFSFFKENDLYERKLLSEGIHLVGISRDLAAEKIAEKLTELKHHKIILPDNYKNSRQSIFFEKHGLECFYCVGLGKIKSIWDYDLREFAVNIKSIIDKHKARAIYLHDDTIAAETIRSLLGLGLSVPEDISVVGFGNQSISRCNIVPISSINMPHEAMLKCTLDIIDGHIHDFRHEFKPELICRVSTGLCPGQTN